MQGEPAIRFQALRDLTDADAETVNKERRRISQEGWGAQLLALQDPEGTWAKGMYSPKWKSTTYTMLLLQRFEMESTPQIEKTCKIMIDKGLYSDGGICFWPSWKRSETCVTGMVLAILSTFQFRHEGVPTLAEYLFKEQMPDGGWNCEAWRGAVHSSFHTTLSVLEGLRRYETYYLPAAPDAVHHEKIIQSRNRALEFLLQHRLFRSHRTGEVVSDRMKLFSFPPRWFYDVLRGLDFAQAVDAPYDERYSDAIELLLKKQTRAGLWKLQNRHAGKTWFEMEKPGKPSRWNTLRALRVLKWRPITDGSY